MPSHHNRVAAHRQLVGLVVLVALGDAAWLSVDASTKRLGEAGDRAVASCDQRGDVWRDARIEAEALASE